MSRPGFLSLPGFRLPLLGDAPGLGQGPPGLLQQLQLSLHPGQGIPVRQIAVQLLQGCQLLTAAGQVLLGLPPLPQGLLLFQGLPLGLALLQLLQAGLCLTQLQRQTEEYLRLREDALQAEDAARTAAASAEGLTQQLQGQLVTLLAQVQPFWPEANGADGVRVALTAALRRREALDGAALQVQQAQIRCDAMSRHLPQPPLPDPEETLPRPVLSREQIDAALPQVRNQLREARSRVDSLTGQLRTMDSPESLQAQRDQCTRRLEALQAEYDAIALAMEALTQANTVLQTRFSPALGAETARIFSALTAGRYDKVLLDRNLSLSAQPAGDAMPRALSLLSQGAGDQLYLAVRLAICRMVLPRDKAAPLILDDALANFDDQRLAAALDWLLEESRSRQILLFTCHRREGDYLRDRAHVISLN